MSNLDVIIPTFGRRVEVLHRSIDSLLINNNYEFINKIIVIDQNPKRLEFKYKNIHSTYNRDIKFVNEKIIHLFNIEPSLTNARNIGATISNAKIICFIDDDVEVLPGTLMNYLNIFAKYDVSFIGGREILVSKLELNVFELPAFLLKKIVKKLLLRFKEVAKISKRGFFYCDFSKNHKELVHIDTVRGCNFAVRKQNFELVGGFDTKFYGNAIREESDFCHRIIKKGGYGVYTSRSCVIHYRQVGGCNNLDKSLNSFKMTLDNELYFQKKHFKNISYIFFGLRLLPFSLINLKATSGKSIMILLDYVNKLKIFQTKVL